MSYTKTFTNIFKKRFKYFKMKKKKMKFFLDFSYFSRLQNQCLCGKSGWCHLCFGKLIFFKNSQICQVNQLRQFQLFLSGKKYKLFYPVYIRICFFFRSKKHEIGGVDLILLFSFVFHIYPQKVHLLQTLGLNQQSSQSMPVHNPCHLSSHKIENYIKKKKCDPKKKK